MNIKQIIASVSALLMLVCVPSFAVSDPASDSASLVAQSRVEQVQQEEAEIKKWETINITTSFQSSAEELYKQGLMEGHEYGFNLEETPSRSETAAMLVRLLGAEEEVLSGDYSCHFSDVPQWASKYVGYLYEKGYVQGVSKSRFGSSDDVNADTYAYFMMEALGYSSDEDQLTPSNALLMAASEGLITENECIQLESSAFSRGSMAYMTERTLGNNMRGEEETLVSYLDGLGVIKDRGTPVFKTAPVVQEEQEDEYAGNDLIVQNANRYLGIRYRSGGKSPATGFDCSGFVGFVMIQSGVCNQFYGSCVGLHAQCESVNLNNARPGDIVFFSGTYGTKNKYSHVGIYLGDGKMIHSSSSKGISVATIDSGYWANHYAGIGRPGTLC